MINSIFSTLAPQYWGADLPVIPLRERSKVPAINGWTEFADRMPDETEQEVWLQAFPNGNIGLPLGPASGICIVDIDTEDEALIAAILEVLPASPWRRVGKKGMALAYKFDGLASFKLKGETGMLVELLSSGNQVVLPPSIHPDTGLPYRANVDLWEVKSDLPSLPIDIESRLRAALGLPKARAKGGSRAKSGSGSPTSRFDWWLRQKLAERAEKVANAPESDRNNTLFRQAAAMANDVSAADSDWAPYADSLRAAAKKTSLDDLEIDGTLQSAWTRGSQTPTPWIKVANDWIYVGGSDKFYHLQSGAILTCPAFRKRYASINPAERLGFDNFLTHLELVEMVQEVVYEPQHPRGVVGKNGLRWFNDYRASTIAPEEGDATPFVDYLSYLVPDEDERAHLIRMLAHLVRKPGEKLAHALILGSRVHGVGKSTLISILERLMGPTNCCKATSDELADKYQAYLDGKLLVTIEELDLGSGFKTYHKLKDLITAETSPMRKLYENSRNVPNNATFMFLTNLDVPLLIEKSDRRFFVVMSPAQVRSREYWTEFNAWWRNSLGVIRYYLDQVDLDGFDRFAPPPMTAAKERLIERSASPTAQDLREMIESREWPFVVDLVTRDQVEKALKLRNPRIGRSDVDRALSDVGAENLGQHRLPKGTSLIGLHPEKPTLWAVRNVRYWQYARREYRLHEFLATTTTLPVVDGMNILPYCLLEQPPIVAAKEVGPV